MLTRMKIALLAFSVIIIFTLPFKGVSQQFEIQANQFLLDGKAFRIFSGEMHYPRIPEAYWKERLLMAKAMGLNTVCTYVFWNLHETYPGKYDFQGQLNIRKFIETAQEVGLYVIIRPGPYICAETDFGGLPPWLLKNDKIKLRSSDTSYFNPVRRYLKRLSEEIKDLQITSGGPIIMFQVENEYGAYGRERKYINMLTDLFKESGFNVPFYYSDWAIRPFMNAGSAGNKMSAANFGKNPERNFRRLGRIRKGVPQMCGEYWCGWFNAWGDNNWIASNTEQQVTEVKWMLENNKSFNLYMFHGGTNFGFMSGANDKICKPYSPFLTSYDYDAPLSEGGVPTEKYMQFRKLLSEYQPRGIELPDPPTPPQLIEIPGIELNSTSELIKNMNNLANVYMPLSMEKLGINNGFILYRTKLGHCHGGKLRIHGLHDMAYVFIDNQFIGCLDRRFGQECITVPAMNKDNAWLRILVESNGRVNFGKKLKDPKGITGKVSFKGKKLKIWQVSSFTPDEESIGKLSFSKGRNQAFPSFYKGLFTLSETGDTYLDMTSWTKGMVWVNGHSLGRYWNAGPQQRLYLPGPWLKKGENEIIVLEMISVENNMVKGVKTMK